MLRPSETALIIVDMQNAYASPGGYTSLAGFDVLGSAGRQSPISSKPQPLPARSECR